MRLAAACNTQREHPAAAFQIDCAGAPNHAPELSEQMHDKVFDTPDAVEAAYVKAFQSGDLEAMMEVWADQEDIVCTHPIAGPQQQGRKAVLEGWLGVFAREIDIQVLLVRVRRIRLGDTAVHCGEEHLVRTSDRALRGINNYTNVFTRTAEGWRLVAHHASPGPSAGAPEEPSLPSDPGSHLH